MNLIEFDDVSLKFGTQQILNHVDLAIRPEERVCLIGRNGAGKSTLFRLILQQQSHDSGEIRYKNHLRISMLQQQMPDTEKDMLVIDVVRQGLADLQALLDKFKEISEQPNPDPIEMTKVQQAIEAQDGWDIDVKIQRVMTQLSLPAQEKLGDLSGGWQRRVLLGKALVSNPHLLLLDEPTNHLDIATIEWLEGHIMSCGASIVFITHDRSFLRKLATRIIELDRGRIWSWEGNYDQFVIAKEQALHNEKVENKEFDKKLAKEEVWIRQGVKARGTRNQGRVKDLMELREVAAARVKPQGKVKLHIEESEPSGKTVIELKRVSHQFESAHGQKLLDNFSLKIRRGERIGIIGNNGVGKTTLLRILLGQLDPNDGIVKMGTNLHPAFFDQMRETLEMEKNVAYNVGDGKDYIRLHGKDVHVIGYLKNFLFSPDQSRTPMKALSGGEVNRVLLAKICSRPSNLMMLDEPTNDLDLELLEVLEDAVKKYTGTLIVVSHDRQFLDSVVDSILVFEDDGKIHHYKGGYSQWVAQNKALAIKDTPVVSKQEKIEQSKAAQPQATAEEAKPKKVSYKIQREYDLLPEEISSLEEKLEDLEKVMSDESFYTQDFDVVQPYLDEQAALKEKLDQAMERWLELEEMING
ncbi:MAG TPA: ABC transporter ATP-binding protein [Gammaproteobacteria bacterium]|nr:ABC transporter ATP-binding protein [Gammaproteobacteria bacterium]HBF09172.1 ABC transporter ATP-binding protein [Gammaproteobacteria bacterium]HCK93774.1 ABC transporter ATP-binding protein [Gammaproteobacteria bacterium]|tara:strand:- start:63238 stop:65154 length:1917 start_codon:yes stop_codon:yes gene_type:complete